MRERELKRGINELAETAIIRRVRERRRLRIETADIIFFNADAYRLDRELGMSERLALENNLTTISRWPDIIYE